MTKLWYLFIVSMLLMACASTSPSDGSGAAQAPQASGSPGHCHAIGSGDLVLPDRSPSCTPGATDPRVTQANLSTTICSKHSWSKQVRPSENYTNSLKKQQMKEYGFTDSLSSHEEDHAVALEIGGDPKDPHNLWPQPNFHRKDQVENAAHKAVCSNQMQLTTAQQEMASNWVELGKQLHVL